MSAGRNTVFFGVSLTAANVIDILRDNGTIGAFNFVGLLDDNPDLLNRVYYGCRVIGTFRDVLQLRKRMMITHFSSGLANAKNMLVRDYVYRECIGLGMEPLMAVHRNSYVSPSAVLRRGSIVASFATLSTHSEVGENCWIGAGVSVLEGAKIGENVIVNPNCFLAGECSVGSNVYIGPGTNIGCGVHIGENSVIGAGSLVLKDVEANTFGFGSPFVRNRSNDLYREVRKWDAD